jgi:hypothetical protein
MAGEVRRGYDRQQIHQAIQLHLGRWANVRHDMPAAVEGAQAGPGPFGVCATNTAGAVGLAAPENVVGSQGDITRSVSGSGGLQRPQWNGWHVCQAVCLYDVPTGQQRKEENISKEHEAVLAGHLQKVKAFFQLFRRNTF